MINDGHCWFTPKFTYLFSERNFSFAQIYLTFFLGGNNYLFFFFTYSFWAEFTRVRFTRYMIPSLQIFFLLCRLYTFFFFYLILIQNEDTLTTFILKLHLHVNIIKNISSHKYVKIKTLPRLISVYFYKYDKTVIFKF